MAASVGVFIPLAGAFMPIMDFFITNVALPSIDARPRFAVRAGARIAGYGVAYAALLVLGGRLGDRFGRHRLFLGGLAGFGLASLACGLAPDIAVLIGARIVQGAAAALLIPQVLATFHHTLDGERKGRAVALYGATSGIAAVVGQVVGALSARTSMHHLAAGLPGQRADRHHRPAGGHAHRPCHPSPHPVSIDLPGTLLFAATLTAC
jgi:MFS family permease